MNEIGAGAAVKTGNVNGQIGSRVVPKDIWTVAYTPTLSMAYAWASALRYHAADSGKLTHPGALFDCTLADAPRCTSNKAKRNLATGTLRRLASKRSTTSSIRRITTKAQAQTNAKMVFDKVSKKKRPTVPQNQRKSKFPSLKVTDPISKKRLSRQATATTQPKMTTHTSVRTPNLQRASAVRAAASDHLHTRSLPTSNCRSPIRDKVVASLDGLKRWQGLKPEKDLEEPPLAR